MVELEQVKRFRLETLPGHEVVPGTSRGIHKKHTRSRRGGQGSIHIVLLFKYRFGICLKSILG